MKVTRERDRERVTYRSSLLPVTSYRQLLPSLLAVTLRRHFLSSLLVAASWGVVNYAAQANAQAYPVRPIRLLVPLAPGGGNDTVARLVGSKLTADGSRPMVQSPAEFGAFLGNEVAKWEKVARAAGLR